MNIKLVLKLVGRVLLMEAAALAVPLKDLRLRPGVLLAVIVRGSNIIIPEGSSFLQEGDQVIIIARESGILDLNDIYSPELNPGGASL